ncbi:MAG: hypothetical protein FWC68_06425 [Oscillospiraceae bacterium]|nr:hypothetical protein [Oscillospiraceae bacterium]
MRRVTVEDLIYDMTYIFKDEAPVRTNPLGASGSSPYPGNLKNNAIVPRIYGASSAELILSKEAAPYIDYTEFTSFRPGWQKKALNRSIGRYETYYGFRRS